MRIFVSAGEPSGDLHGANLAKELTAQSPGVEIVGFGGDRLKAAGAHLLYPLCDHAVMGLSAVLAELPRFLGVLSLADRYLCQHRPDAIVLIDYPGLHWWLAKRARFHRIPVFYFVPPQIWAWATHRVARMRRYVDHVLCCLPFEQPWYAARGVAAEYVGHPYFDQMAQQRLDDDFIARQMKPGQRIVALLPGSRDTEVQRNFTSMVRVAERLKDLHRDLRFLVAAFKEKQATAIRRQLTSVRLPIEVHVGRTPEIIHLATACVAVSGSVSLELLWHGKPTVIVYRLGKVLHRLVSHYKRSRYITLVNLLAEEELYPEFLTDHCPATAVAEKVDVWLRDEAARQQLIQRLDMLKDAVARPGACRLAAEYILAKVRPRSCVAA
ncbi:MAG: lipid-A-disaccharide synthase [Nitrospira sp.]|nr:lipid-A-disaccharide synthase [Nitrospira sp.]